MLNSNLNNIVDEVTNEKIVFSGITISHNAQIHMGNNPSRLYMNTDYFDINPNNGNQLICKKAGTYNIFVASLGVTNTDWSQVLLINGSIKSSNATYDLSANDTLEMYNNYYSGNSMMACFITLA